MVIGDAIMGEFTRSEKLRGIISRPGNARNYDGLDSLMAEANLYYAIQWKDLVDEVYLSENYRHAEIRPRDLRRLV